MEQKVSGAMSILCVGCMGELQAHDRFCIHCGLARASKMISRSKAIRLLSRDPLAAVPVKPVPRSFGEVLQQGASLCVCLGVRALKAAREQSERLAARRAAAREAAAPGAGASTRAGPAQLQAKLFAEGAKWTPVATSAVHKAFKVLKWVVAAALLALVALLVVGFLLHDSERGKAPSPVTAPSFNAAPESSPRAAATQPPTPQTSDTLPAEVARATANADLPQAAVPVLPTRSSEEAIPPGIGAKPSFDCGAAATPVERLICADSALAQGDVDVAAAYKAAKARVSDVARLRTEQSSWRTAVRDSCVDAECISAAHRRRVLDLRAEAASSP
jgi:hypothetical protein